jgi:hypothetical protein
MAVMTEREMAYSIAALVRRFQATQTAYQLTLNLLPTDVRPKPESIEYAVADDLSPAGPYGPILESFEHELESANPREVLALLYRELFEAK